MEPASVAAWLPWIVAGFVAWSLVLLTVTVWFFGVALPRVREAERAAREAELRAARERVRWMSAAERVEAIQARIIAFLESYGVSA